MLRKDGYVLDIDDYIKIYDLISNVFQITLFFENLEDKTDFPLTTAIADQIQLPKSLMQEFERIFDQDKSVKPTASETLSSVYKLISSKERELDKQFASIISKYKKAGFLTETVESFKNSRRVLSVNAESKRKVKGIIHDESTTGKTVFIEPQEIVELNNALFELEIEKKKEIYKILKELSAFLKTFVEDFELWQKILVRFDLINAKQVFSQSYGGSKPAIADNSNLVARTMLHPLLYLHNTELGKGTVPSDISLNNEKHILVISGPNAGGKSICLKSLGLNQLMLQSGLLISVDERSTFPIFSKLMIDIGDQQSIEGDLSTYSSRLIHMKHFLNQADKKSLVLMDEFGSGSDPKMGGAIAEGVLDALVKKKCFGLITTHYSNIKNYAYRSDSIENGAMLFDKNELKPSYILKIGQPGSSFAFEIAHKIGLDKQVLNYAKHKAGKDSKTVDQLLIDLQQEKKELEIKLEKTKTEEKKLNNLMSSYESMKDELSIRRKRLKLETKQRELQESADTERELQKLIKEIKKEKSLEKAKKAVERVKKEKEENKEVINSLSKDVFKTEIERVKNLKVGQHVKLRSGDEIGTVIDFNEKTVRIEMGLLNLEVPRNEVFMADRPIEAKARSINTDTKINPQTIESKLDIRGYSRVDALDSIQEFLDNALMSSIPQLKILHGKGTGVLKRALWDKAKEYKDIKKIWHPEEEFGGQGVTFISF